MRRDAVPKSEIVEIKKTHLGLSQYNEVIDLNGKISEKRLTYLDSTATALPVKKIQKQLKKFAKKVYANTHTEGHHRGRESTEAVSAARESVGNLVNYDREKDLVTFQGDGATGAINYLAQVLFPKEYRLLLNQNMPDTVKEQIISFLPDDKKIIAQEMMEKPIIITTEMEHHANLITWYNTENVKIVPVDQETGELDLDHLKRLLEENKGKVRLVTVSGASNVIGIINPIHEIAKWTHEAGAEICVDAAQLAAHREIEKRRPDERENLDYIAMSPHKFSGGKAPLIANRYLIAARRGLTNVGGGIVNTVEAYPPRYTLTDDLAAGEEAGTPDVLGIVKTGLAAARLKKKLPKLTKHEKELTRSLMEKLQGETLRDGGIHVIGNPDPEERVGVVAIDVKDVPHPIVTAFLNDSWNVAVRNGCFCAGPLIIKTAGVPQSEIDRIKGGDRTNIPGYVRISFGEHTTQKDINTVVEALTELVQNKEKVLSLYEMDSHGNAARKDGWKQPASWSFDKAVEKISAKQSEWLER